MVKEFSKIFVDAKRTDGVIEIYPKFATAQTEESAFKKAIKMVDAKHCVELVKEFYEVDKKGMYTFWNELYATVTKSKTKGVYAVQTYTVKGKPSYKYDLLSNGTLVNRRR